jgi:hypothetical protein
MDILFITKNSVNTEFVHTPTPSVVISARIVHREDTDIYKQIITQWSVTGILLPSNKYGSVDEQVLKLEQYYTNVDLTEVFLEADNKKIEQMPNDNGVRLTEFSFPDGRGPEWATRRRYTMTFESEGYSTAVKADGDYEYQITYNTKQNGNQTRAVSGSLQDITGKDARVKAEELVADQAWDPYAGYNRTSLQYIENRENSRCSFSLMHEEYFTAFPVDVTNANAQTETRVDKQNIERSRVSGWYEGSVTACNNAINALIAGKTTVSSSIVRDDYANRTSFNIELIDLADGTVVYAQETISIKDQIIVNLYKPVLGGANPIKQSAGKTSATASQVGTIKQFDTWADAPALKWASTDVSNREVTQIEPEWNVASGSYMYTTNYSYQYEFVETPTFT